MRDHGCLCLCAHHLRPEQVHRVSDDYYEVDGYQSKVPVKAAQPSQDGDYWIFYTRLRGVAVQRLLLLRADGVLMRDAVLVFLDSAALLFVLFWPWWETGGLLPYVRHNPYQLNRQLLHPPGVGMAMDDGQYQSLSGVSNWSYGHFADAVAEGQVFLGYPTLAVMALRNENMTAVTTIADDMTRKWIRFKAKAARNEAILAAHYRGMTGREIGMKFGISGGRVSQIIIRAIEIKEERRRNEELLRRRATKGMPELLSQRIELLLLSPRSFNVLTRCGVRTIGDVIKLTERNLLSGSDFGNFGRKSLKELKQVLSELGLRLGSGETTKTYLDGVLKGKPSFEFGSTPQPSCWTEPTANRASLSATAAM